MLSRRIKKLHRYFYLGAVLFFFLPYWPVLIYWAKKPEKNYQRLVNARRWIAKRSARVAGFSFKVRFHSEVDWSKNYIICPNHTSNLDISAVIALCDAPHSYMGKAELLSNPVTGLFFRSIDIPINRESKISAYRAFKKAESHLSQNRNLVIFPEGRIDDQFPPKLGAFKTGPFKLAIETKVAILPVVIQNAWELFWDDGNPRGTTPGTVYIDVLPPIPTEKLEEKDFGTLMAQTFETIDAHWKINKDSL